jgi:hypothetical protein
LFHSLPQPLGPSVVRQAREVVRRMGA